MVNNSTNIHKTSNYLSPELIQHMTRPRYMTLEMVWYATYILFSFFPAFVGFVLLDL